MCNEGTQRPSASQSALMPHALCHDRSQQATIKSQISRTRASLSVLDDGGKTTVPGVFLQLLETKKKKSLLCFFLLFW